MALTGKRILLVDDEDVVVRAVSRQLRSAGAIVETALDGDDAVQKAARTLPDVVLMDVKMPGLGGVEAARTIMSAGPTCVIFMSSPDCAESALALGCPFFDKAADLRHVVRFVDAVLAQWRP
ncbi:MAG: response regulator [Myxococcota bacterium]